MYAILKKKFDVSIGKERGEMDQPTLQGTNQMAMQSRHS
jgi:hypothetical protein